jgi:hypothetical protein
MMPTRSVAQTPTHTYLPPLSSTPQGPLRKQVSRALAWCLERGETAGSGSGGGGGEGCVVSYPTRRSYPNKATHTLPFVHDTAHRAKRRGRLGTAGSSSGSTNGHHHSAHGTAAQQRRQAAGRRGGWEEDEEEEEEEDDDDDEEEEEDEEGQEESGSDAEFEREAREREVRWKWV